MLRLFAVMLVALGVTAAQAQDPKPTAKDIAAIRACPDKNAENGDAAERNCIHRLVAMPCTKRPQGQSTAGMADCFRVEQVIWETLLAENLKKLSEELDGGQKEKLKAMQDAWATSRERTCAFYWDKIQGSIATYLAASCMARETARRALLLRFFQGL
jgi:uncharacterized protein YecT (DUF1311 family)